MSNINQLLAKALSTTSEDEAMSCLRMARKKGGRLEESSAPAEYNGHDAKYWYDKAYKWYHEAKKHSDGLSPEQQKHLYRMYQNECESVQRLRQEKHTLEREISKLKDLPKGTWKLPVIFLQAFIILMLMQMIS
jgi:hypothetical protein